jgi:hypothetical protein
MTPEKLKKIKAEWYEFEMARIAYFKKHKMFSDKIALYESIALTKKP